MIQRIQTIYLLLTTALVVVSLFMPLAYFIAEYEIFNLYAIGLRGVTGEIVQSTMYMFVLLVAAAVLPIINIFLFNRRMLQIRLCVVEIVLLVGSIVMMCIYYFLSCRALTTLEDAVPGLHPAVLAPLVAIVFAYLAARAIFDDELKIRSIDRIR